jgi:mono/diheme cytochrome c family protein
MALRLAVVALTVAGCALTTAAFAADPNKGREIARRWCAVCHLVATDQERVPTVAPPFATIGRRPGFDVKQLQQSMLAPHPRMPDRGLSREEAEDIAAYIAGLR